MRLSISLIALSILIAVKFYVEGSIDDLNEISWILAIIAVIAGVQDFLDIINKILKK